MNKHDKQSKQTNMNDHKQTIPIEKAVNICSKFCPMVCKSIGEKCFSERF